MGKGGGKILHCTFSRLFIIFINKIQLYNFFYVNIDSTKLNSTSYCERQNKTVAANHELLKTSLREQMKISVDKSFNFIVLHHSRSIFFKMFLPVSII